MNKYQTTHNESPESGLSILPDGRVQIIFKHTDMDAIMELPKNIFSVTRELCGISDPMTEECKFGLFRILSLASELLPEPERMAAAYRQLDKSKG